MQHRFKMFCGLAALAALMSGTAHAQGDYQPLCKDNSCCETGSVKKECVIPASRWTIQEDGPAGQFTLSDYRVLQKRFTKDGYQFGVIGANGNVVAEPKCRKPYGLMYGKILYCVGQFGTLDVFSLDGRRVLKDNLGWAISDEFEVGGKLSYNHGFIRLAETDEENIGKPSRFEWVINPDTGEAEPAEAAEIAEGSAAGTILHYKSRILEWNDTFAPRYGVATGRSVLVDPVDELEWDISIPLTDTRQPVPLPDGVLGLVNIGGDLGIRNIVVYEDETGISFAPVSLHPAQAIAAAPGLRRYKGIWYERGPAYMNIFAGQRQDGKWKRLVVDNAQEEIGIPRDTTEEIMADAGVALAEQVAKQKAWEEEQERLTAQSARECFSAGVNALKGGAWVRLPASVRQAAITTEGYKAAGRNPLGDDACAAYNNGPEWAYTDYSLLENAPVEEIIAAGRAESYSPVKITILKAGVERNDLNALLTLADYYSTQTYAGADDDAWELYLRAADMGSGYAVYGMAEMEYKSITSFWTTAEERAAGRPFLEYIAQLYQLAIDMGYAPAQARLDAVNTTLAYFDEADIKAAEAERMRAYYQERARLWQECAYTGGTGVGSAEFTCFVDSQGNKLNRYGMP